MTGSSPCWRALEANPDVISQYTRTLGGPQNVSFCDILSTEDWALDMIPQPVHAILLVYPIKESSEKRSKELQQSNKLECEKNDEKKRILPHLWFTKQTVGNACGTVALLHIFGNLRDVCPVQPGGYLEAFYEKSIKLNAEERAISLETDQSIMAAHREAEDGGQSAHSENVNEHFVAFVNCQNYVCEFDGRKKLPLVHDSIHELGFLKAAASIIKRQYIDADPEELRFSLIAVTGSGSQQI